MKTSIDETLNIIAGGFSCAGEGGPDVMWYAVHALKALLAASQLARGPASGDAAGNAGAAIIRALPAIVEAAEPAVPAADVYSGLSAATDLVHDFVLGPVSRHDVSETLIADDRFDHVALLSAELDRLLCKRRIAERGNPLNRLVQFRSASAAERTGQPLH